MPPRRPDRKLQFAAKLCMSAEAIDGSCFAFLVFPEDLSRKLPRRGRTSVSGDINGHTFQATLEPDGQLSHWLIVSTELCEAAGVTSGDIVAVQVVPLVPEPEPQVPPDIRAALSAVPQACRTWEDTTVIARVDWIHWMTSAKQARTRTKRIKDACDMLAAGKKRVCCFDPSGYYSKALSAPTPAE